MYVHKFINLLFLHCVTRGDGQLSLAAAWRLGLLNKRLTNGYAAPRLWRLLSGISPHSQQPSSKVVPARHMVDNSRQRCGMCFINYAVRAAGVAGFHDGNAQHGRTTSSNHHSG